MVKLEKSQMPQKWRMIPNRVDLMLSHYAHEKGWDVMCSERDHETLPDLGNLDGLQFRKGVLRVWGCKVKGEKSWCVAEISPGGNHYYNHRTYPDNKLAHIIIHEKPWPVDGH